METADGKIRRRRRKQENSDGEAEAETPGDSLGDNGRPKRECPVPKPGGLVGQMMGFEQKEREKPLDVVVRSLRSRNARANGDEKTP